MKSLIIYDNTGKLYYQASGNVNEPIGLPFMWVEIPEGKYINRIDTLITPHQPIYWDINSLDLDTCTIEELKAYQIAKSKENLEAYLENNPVTSKCHGGIKKNYSITKEKQSLLTQMILITQVAIQAGIDYQPSWNAQGEPCTYDWTLAELQQLAFEAEAVVRPLVSKQQTIEAHINTAKTKDDVMIVNIEF
ncbi:hypothetical protein [Anaerocolumna sp. MB42-C2]|uniref:hypothetical protein n=1 Tax=Anaerocolumna sp. MB42-C2 TaxID=3070997 RepID=UPI0027E1A1B9|nr:hypothetical protein [Anaerocolumna sp. MB42-C2]WMJ88850.1 hypothetical protein RBU59_04855 [Anaerocolumna sp. MB42-C2]